jgi:hypothetical protein
MDKCQKVVQHPHNIRRTDLVAVTRHVTAHRALTPPLAVGRMAVHAEELQKDAKGKAVHILHTFGDSLWDMGRKSDIPDSFDMSPVPAKTDAANETDKAEVTSHISEIEQDKDEGRSRHVESTDQYAEVPSAVLPETTPQGRHLQINEAFTTDSMGCQKSQQSFEGALFKPFILSYRSSHPLRSRLRLPHYIQHTYCLLARYFHKRCPLQLTSNTLITKI